MLKFRSGKKSILIATDALEEGIDVATCNLVVCFNTLTSLKSYIQRRGRASMHTSQCVIMISTDSGQTKLDSWLALDEALIDIHKDADRASTQTLIENGHELVDDCLYLGATEYVAPNLSLAI